MITEAFEKFYLEEDDFDEAYHEGYLAGYRDGSDDSYIADFIDESDEDTFIPIAPV